MFGSTNRKVFQLKVNRFAFIVFNRLHDHLLQLKYTYSKQIIIEATRYAVASNKVGQAPQYVSLTLPCPEQSHFPGSFRQHLSVQLTAQKNSHKPATAATSTSSMTLVHKPIHRVSGLSKQQQQTPEEGMSVARRLFPTLANSMPRRKSSQGKGKGKGLGLHRQLTVGFILFLPGLPT